MAEVKFFTYDNSPFGARVQIALTEKCIPFDRISVNLVDKPQELLEANPIHKKVPTIVHNGKPVAESLVILEYLEDAFPAQVPLLPTDPFERAKVRFWVDYIVNDAHNQAFLQAFTSNPGSPEKLAAMEQCAKAFRTVEDAMTSFSAEGPFFTGPTFGYLDVVLGPLSSSRILIEKLAGLPFPGPEELPRLNKWMEAAKERPSIKSTLRSPEDHYNIVSAIFKRRAAAKAAVSTHT